VSERAKKPDLGGIHQVLEGRLNWWPFGWALACFRPQFGIDSTLEQKGNLLFPITARPVARIGDRETNRAPALIKQGATP
jgi:hypothetical protein